MIGISRKTLGALAVAASVLTGALGTVATTAVAQAAPLVTPMHAKAPGTGELRAKMAVLFNAGASRSARAAELENGEAGLAAFDRAAALIAVAPASWRWDVVGPVSVDGDVLSAKLLTSTEGYEPWYFDLSWRQVGGTWKLTQESVCTIGNFVGAGC
ncbi:hypothetical protein [Nocardia gamkensis]|uniref:Low molecular weight antigen MTB12-like C-terminal domain-containing protein n=1 Tax=Nocardia gamkensis TaxID=352869 RepID=A0A7X6L967_9NOCA|nr:hypothetical protein [Nocardia gamkensis]NKY30156.1 hypothetical protein [Nocardia gamkensis]NQE70870.1 hypothetical protein [Nocardia gamkensis]